MHKTVDVEIKTEHALTERPDAEKGQERRLLNGPRRAQGTKRKLLVYCDVRHTSVARDMMVS